MEVYVALQNTLLLGKDYIGATHQNIHTVDKKMHIFFCNIFLLKGHQHHNSPALFGVRAFQSCQGGVNIHRSLG